MLAYVQVPEGSPVEHGLVLLAANHHLQKGYCQDGQPPQRVLLLLWLQKIDEMATTKALAESRVNGCCGG